MEGEGSDFCVIIHRAAVQSVNSIADPKQICCRMFYDTLVKRGAELSTDHHVVSWIRSWGRLPDRPGKPVRVNCESLVEAPIHGVFNSHLRKNFSCIPG